MTATRKHRDGAYLDGDPTKSQFVGFVRGKYRGPVAEVRFDETWLWVSTDDYEGTAMLNIESLPKLRAALARVAKLVASKK